MDFPLLSTLIWLPIAGGILVLLVGDRQPGLTRWMALGVSLATFVASVPLFSGFDRTTAAMQFVERASWIERYSVEYFLGVDG
ncbi:MAG: NADH-quinone oxidoreductase subunit M, partial [Chromatiales bacterium]|nr:NADH-quinone oxidoreductase subunit M [Chromatiales bacterium]